MSEEVVEAVVRKLLKQMLKIEQSLYTIDILARGGFVEVEERECYFWHEIRNILDDMQYRMQQRSPDLPKGKHRIVLIVEPVAREVVE